MHVILFVNANVHYVSLSAMQAGGLSADGSYAESRDEAGHQQLALASAEDIKLANDFKQLCSWARCVHYILVKVECAYLVLSC
jgi:hypothetical protein